MFEIQKFLEDCQCGAAEHESHKVVRDVVAQAVSEPVALLDALGDPVEAGVTKLFHSPDLTVLNVVWAPQMTVLPHDHHMWAVIGVYAGAEDNIFWRRVGGRIEAAGARALREKDAVPLGPEIVHSVTNPTDKFTGAIHVYGGDFFSTSRSEWDPQTLVEKPYDVEKNIQLFAQANARYMAGQQLPH